MNQILKSMRNQIPSGKNPVKKKKSRSKSIILLNLLSIIILNAKVLIKWLIKRESIFSVGALKRTLKQTMLILVNS